LTSSLNGFEIFTGLSYRGSIYPTGAKIVLSYWEFWEIELEWSKSKENKVCFEIAGGLGNWGFEKLGFHSWTIWNSWLKFGEALSPKVIILYSVLALGVMLDLKIIAIANYNSPLLANHMPMLKE